MPCVKGCCTMQMQQENGMGGADSPGGKRKGPPLTEEERRIRRKEINRESARRIRRRKNNEMEEPQAAGKPCHFSVRRAVLTAAHQYVNWRIAPEPLQTDAGLGNECGLTLFTVASAT